MGAKVVSCSENNGVGTWEPRNLEIRVSEVQSCLPLFDLSNMSGGTLIDDHVSAQQCKRAVDALLSHASKFEEEKAETQLLSGKEQNVWLDFFRRSST